MTFRMNLTGAAIAACLCALTGQELMAAAWAADGPQVEVQAPVSLATWRLVSDPVPRYVHVGVTDRRIVP
ncbi:hypothetical protein ACFSM5_21635 [Lacibacterium aquatile]|uniref:Uncharacterized protein n=1 Tax=Lacibacterium aquatile TaxID=1168082 RepID=A0ABW5DWZ4_9PROT